MDVGVDYDCNCCQWIGLCKYEGEHFTCAGCGQVVPYCNGCADDMPELCDSCWYQVKQWREVARRDLDEKTIQPTTTDRGQAGTTAGATAGGRST